MSDVHTPDPALTGNRRMRFHTRKWVKPEDLNPNRTLFGGRLLAWIDEEAAIYVICQLGNRRVVTKYMSEINFINSASEGDIIEMGFTATAFGRTSVTLKCEVRNKISRKIILTIEKMVFVNLDEAGNSAPHGKSEITYGEDAREIPPLASASGPPTASLPARPRKPTGSLIAFMLQTIGLRRREPNSES